MEINYLFGKILININAIYAVEKSREQGLSTLIINEKVIPFDSEGERNDVYELIKSEILK